MTRVVHSRADVFTQHTKSRRVENFEFRNADFEIRLWIKSDSKSAIRNSRFFMPPISSQVPEVLAQPTTSDQKILETAPSSAGEQHSAAPSAQALAAAGLFKSYGKRCVVDDVSLHVERGEVVGLLGANGAGKTTTFYMIVGLERPDSGNVLLGDQDLTKLPMYLRARL